MSTLRIHFARPMWGEAERLAMEELWRSATRHSHGPITNGGKVIEFEAAFVDFCGGGAAIAVSNCAAALYISMQALGIGAGDEVIMPALTHVAMANACVALGARPVFVDCHADSGNLDPDRLGIVASSRTKAVGVVHYHGQAAYMRSTLDFCRRHNLKLIEDCAVALGTTHQMTGKHVGLIGDVGCFSFYPSKHITTGEGGMILTNNAELAEKCRLLRSFGYGNRHEVVGPPGLNFRMTEIQAAIGVAQMQKLPRLLKQRNENLWRLKKMLEPLETVGGSYALQLLLPDRIDRDRLKDRLAALGIQTSTTYPRPVTDHQWYIQKYGRQSMPVAERFCYRGLTLPVGPHLDRDDLMFLARSVKETMERMDEGSVSRGRRVRRASSGYSAQAARA